jgi:hypothetical protein
MRVSMLLSTHFWFMHLCCEWIRLLLCLLLLIFFPSYQQYLGLSVLQTTLRFIPSGLSCCKLPSPVETKSLTGISLGLIALFVGPALSRIPGFYLLIGAIFANITSALLFTLPISPSTSYWAYGFPAMCLTISIEFQAPVLSLFVVKCLDQNNQAIGGGLLQTSNNLGKAIGLAIAGSVQKIVENSLPTTFRDGELGALTLKAEGRVGDQVLLTGIRAAQSTNIVFALLALGTVVTYLRVLRTL